MSDQPIPNNESQTSFSKLLPWIVLLLSALGLFYFVEKGCGGGKLEPEKTETPADTTHTSSMPADTLPKDSIH
ncbi:MAG TPA: hypothetical protein VFV79_10565 [Saprospiraceae bacterium]|nr:hypothetical protein [Saprospiraceae bacterium]